MATPTQYKGCGKMAGYQITVGEFNKLRTLLYDRFGFHLTDQKKTLVIERLQKVLRQRGFSNFSQYYDFVQRDRTGEALLELIDRISTNHTFFFREQEHFNFLNEAILPELVKRGAATGRKKLRIWSAGCSSGEEPYSVAIELARYFKNELKNWDIAILATDISTSVLAKAEAGIYNENQLQGVENNMRRSYFQVCEQGWQVKPEIRRLVTFRRLNLMLENYPFRGLFDLILCRNVMIYFDSETRENLIAKFAKYTQQGGYLFIGHSESLTRENKFFKYIQPAVYRR
jgi:chemotaxis protein methyltransferase CheR